MKAYNQFEIKIEQSYWLNLAQVILHGGSNLKSLK